MPSYHLFGLTVRSDLDLPACPASAAGLAPDVVVRLGDVPRSLSGVADGTQSFQAAPGRVLIHISTAARYLVADGREIVVEPAPRSDPARLLAYLTGSAFGALLHQRGVVPLHASSVRLGRSAAAFAGVRGAGKSTLAAALRGPRCGILADDLSAVTLSSTEAPELSAGFARVKLTADAIRALGLGDEPGLPTANDKLQLEWRQAGEPEPLPLRRLYVLDPGEASEPVITPVTGLDRLEVFRRHTFRGRYLVGLGRVQEHGRSCMRIARAVEIYRVRRPSDLDQLPVFIRTLADHLRELD